MQFYQKYLKGIHQSFKECISVLPALLLFPYLLLLTSIGYSQDILGDVNQDGNIDILDVVRTVNIILEHPPEPTDYELWASEVNLDGDINVLDLLTSMNFILFETPLNEEWAIISTNELQITFLKIYSSFLYAGTYNEGLWRLNLDTENKEWEYLGLSNEELGIEYYRLRDLIQNSDDSNSWVVTGVNYDGDEPGVLKTTDGGLS